MFLSLIPGTAHFSSSSVCLSFYYFYRMRAKSSIIYVICQIARPKLRKKMSSVKLQKISSEMVNFLIYYLNYTRNATMIVLQCEETFIQVSTHITIDCYLVIRLWRLIKAK